MAQVVVEMSGDEAKLYRAYQRIIDQAAKLDNSTKQNKRSHDEAFGDRAANQLTNYMGKFVGIASVLGSVSMAMRKVREEADALAAKQREAFGGMGELAQLATSPAQMRQLVRGAEELYAMGAAPSMAQAANIQFAIESAGMGKYRRDIGLMASSGLVANVAPAVNAAAALEASMGAAETGGFASIISKGFGASMGAPARMEAILQAAALSGPQAKALGFSDEQLLAGVATLAKPAGSAEQAGTLLESFTKQIEKEGIGGKYLKPGRSLMDYVQDIAALEAKGTSVRTILGNRQEALTGYRLLREGSANYQQNMQNILQADQDQMFYRNVGYYQEIPSMAAAQGQRQRLAQAEVAGDRRGTMANLADIIEEDLVSRARQRYGAFGGLAAVGERAGSWMDRLMGNEQFVRRWSADATPETQERIAQILERIEQNTRADAARARAAAGQQSE